MLQKFKNSEFYQDWLRIKEDMRPMSFWKKIDHLWYCYKVYIIFATISLTAIFVLIGSFLSYQSKEELVAGMLVNVEIEQSGMSYLSGEYETYLKAEEKQYVSLDYTSFGPLDDPFNADENYSRAMILLARVEGEMLDYAILDKDAVQTYVKYDVFLDLREFFTAEELSAFEAEGRVKYAQYEGKEDRWPIAVEITNVPFVKDNIRNKEPIYFALSVRNPNLAMCRNVWNYIHAWKAE